MSLQEGVSPQAWKVAKLIPLPQNKKEPFTGANCRPISFVPVLSKLMESCLTESHFIFLSMDLTMNFSMLTKRLTPLVALMQMTDQWLSDVRQENDSSCCTWIKLEGYGFNTFNWMRSYLSNRSQTVLFNGSFSNVKTVQRGVPQGSCLGPLLYCIFTNDMPLALRKDSLADDSTVYLSSSSGEELNVLLQNDITLIVDWVAKNNLSLNVFKTKCNVFGLNFELRQDIKSCVSINSGCIKLMRLNF